MEIIDLNEIFNVLKREKYCIVKYKSFDQVLPGNDIDIFAFNVNALAKMIINQIEKQIFEQKDFKIHVSSYQDNKCYVDVLKKGKVYIRFDICGQMPDYKRAKVKEGLFACTVEKAEKIILDNGNYEIKIASKKQEMLIRYLEYIEWYERRPDKIKHLNYVLDNLKSEEERKEFLDDLHYYTGFPELKYEIKKGKTGPIENLKFIVDKCKGKSIGDLWAIFRQKFL